METTIACQFNTLKLIANNYTIREGTMDGKKHLVVPVVMMVEGVHSGSLGPMLHTAEELAKWTEAWNGIPVTISHPTVEGINVSANSPEVLDSSSVGRIFNTYYKDGLRAEAWIDYEKISAKSEDALTSIEKMAPLEISVGVFSDSDDTEGEWNGETYEYITTNYRPDHLALLPGEQGACSWADGCGIRVNQKGGADVKDKFKTFQELSQQGLVVSLLFNEMGYREIQQALSAKLQDLNAEGMYHYIEEVFDDYIVYSRWEESGGETLYKQGYTMDDNSNIEFNGNVSEVRKKVEYVTNKMRRTKQVNNKNEGGKMSNSKPLCPEAKVDALIANKQTHWQQLDREWLLEQDEGTIAKMSPMVPDVVELTTEEIQANKEAVINDYKASKKTIEDYTADMPEEMKAEVEGGVKLYIEHRAALVKSIMDNTADGIWEEDALKAMDDKTLEKVSKSIKQPADYSGMGAGGGQTPSGEQVEIPVEYQERKEDK